MSYEKFGPGFDWRGVPLAPGQMVIYGAPVGRSIAMVEAEVVELYMTKPEYGTPQPKVKLRIINRAYGGSYKEFVSVGQDRVTIVEKLPASGIKKTATDEIREREEKEALQKKTRATHDLDPEPRGSDSGWRAWYDKPCRSCSLNYYECRDQVCVSYVGVI